VKGLLGGKDSGGRSVLAMAATGGNKDVFKKALEEIQNDFTDVQVHVEYRVYAIRPPFQKGSDQKRN